MAVERLKSCDQHRSAAEAPHPGSSSRSISDWLFLGGFGLHQSRAAASPTEDHSGGEDAD